MIREQSCEEFLSAVGTGDAKREWAGIGLGAEMEGQEWTAFALGGDEIDGKSSASECGNAEILRLRRPIREQIGLLRSG
jgi:hypothetical protein